MMQGLIEVTKTARSQMAAMLEKRGTPEAFIRLGIKTAGCSGLGYKLEYADNKDIGDEEVAFDDVKVLVDAKSLIYLVGTEVDYEEDDLRQGFTFNNPNKKGECGCGESFTV